uniref:Uncharacterized protein n=1 Tax=Magallana gigas TaxID=29159 RepID=A0A8W8ITP7_MAGGI
MPEEEGEFQSRNWKRNPMGRKVDAALKVIQDWIEMTEDTKDPLPIYPEIHRRVTSGEVRAAVLVQRALIALLSDCASDHRANQDFQCHTVISSRV